MTEENKECTFCKIANKEIQSEIVEESENFVAIRVAPTPLQPLSEPFVPFLVRSHTCIT